MQFRESMTVAVDALRSNKLRAILTSIGVIIGSASIVLVVTVALTSQNFVISQIEAIGSNLVWAEMVKTPDKVAASEPSLNAARHRRGERNHPGRGDGGGIYRHAHDRGGARRDTAGQLDRRHRRVSANPPPGYFARTLFRQRGHGNARQSVPDHQGTR